jgi:sigma-B regulation protein RsbU (phosphoserine phosphatase)
MALHEWNGSRMNILVVDDEKTTLTLLLYLLQEFGADVTAVLTAEEALTHLRSHPSEVDLLITDINMPGINGFDLLKMVRQLSPAMPVIVLTGREDREAVRQALQLGANDYLDKPVHKTTLFQSVERVLQSSPRKHLEQSFLVRRKVQEAQQEILQSSCLRKLVEAGVLALWHRPISDAGGDFIYGQSSRDYSTHTLVLVDAAGHDISSLYYVAECKGLMEALITPACMPDDSLVQLNKKLLTSDHTRHLCAMILHWDAHKGRLQIANAAIPHGVVLRATGDLFPLRIDGSILGLLDDPAFDSANIQLEPGDRLLLFTDGVECFGEEEHLAKVWKSLKDMPLAEALRQLVQRMRFEAPDAAQDDLLLLALEQPPFLEPSQPKSSNALQILMHSDRRAIEPCVQQVLDFVRSMLSGPDDNLSERLGTVLRELASNAILHGNKSQPFAYVKVSVYLEDSQLVLQVTDSGQGFDLAKELLFENNASPLRDGRRGLLTAENFADELTASGSEVRAIFRLKKKRPTIQTDMI